ncbi:MAG: DUF2283 domain-containing protein [Candidatus Blackburnbacteria bacterium]|nr:DUF2283 domain-containing protein [Candidatus Blackburnbacteria bacterium]
MNKSKKPTKRIYYESEDDVLNIWFSEKKIDYAEDAGGVIVHFTEDGEPVYMEVLFASRFLKDIHKTLPKEVKKQIWSAIN